jgi:hypothetical protein
LASKKRQSADAGKGCLLVMRHPFFNMTRLALEEGESDFKPLEGHEGIVVTLGPNTSFFDRPGRSVWRWPGTKTVPRQSPHPIPRRSWIMNEFNTFLRFLCGGGDVKLNRIKTLGKQREILLTAGDRNVVEIIDMAHLAREGVPPLQFLQTAYLCSSANMLIQSVPCDASAMSWSRAPYAYRTQPLKTLSKPAILCLSGRTMVWCERLEPGESRDFALGNVIAASCNIVSKLRPTSQCHPDDYKAAIFEEGGAEEENALPASRKSAGRIAFKKQLREFAAASRILFESVRAREGFFVCELTNHSDKPAYVYVQLNKSGLYGGSGLIGVVIKIAATFFRFSHLSFGH